jgi:hypothetical protein
MKSFLSIFDRVLSLYLFRFSCKAKALSSGTFMFFNSASTYFFIGCGLPISGLGGVLLGGLVGRLDFLFIFKIYSFNPTLFILSAIGLDNPKEIASSLNSALRMFSVPNLGDLERGEGDLDLGLGDLERAI